MSTEAELRAELERLKRENEALETRPKAATSLKVTEVIEVRWRKLPHVIEEARSCPT